MKNSFKKVGFCIVILIFAFCTLNFAGCATVPRLEPGVALYNINGINYLPLVSLCERKNINWDYDTFTRKITLTRGTDEVNLMVGSSIIVINGSARDIKYPVEIYQGAVVVPYGFKSETLDSLSQPAAPKELPALSFRGIRKIVIDPGHGGDDPGAIGRTGLREKDVTLDLAKRLKALLISGGFEVMLTREYDRTLSLAQRSRFANTNKADLFISIHANANPVRKLNGFEVYCISSKVDDSRRALLAAENAELSLENATFYNADFNLRATVWDLIYTQNRIEAAELAGKICSAASGNLNTRIIGVKGAPFYVLKNTDMPAILVEVGFLSNTSEERMLKNNFYRQQIAESIALGVKSYCRGYSR